MGPAPLSPSQRASSVKDIRSTFNGLNNTAPSSGNNNNNSNSPPTGTPSNPTVFDTVPGIVEFLEFPDSEIKVLDLPESLQYTGRQATMKEPIHFAVSFKFQKRIPDTWRKPALGGELTKPGSVLSSSWKPRWYVVSGQTLFCLKGNPQNSKLKDKDLLSAALNLRKGSVEEKTDKLKGAPKYVLSVNGFDPATKKKATFTLGLKSEDEKERWMKALTRGTQDSVNIETAWVDHVVKVTLAPETGFVGLTPDWRVMLRQCGVTEAQFYQLPNEIVQMYKQYKQGTGKDKDIVQHEAEASEGASLEDLVTQEGSPHNRYINFQIIGKGTFGEVYEAVNKITGKKVAIKKLLVTPKRAQLFLSEIQIHKSAQQSPCVVQFFDVYKVQNHLWMVLEYMAGGNLTQILSEYEIAKKDMAEPQIAYIAMETLKALSYIHSTHRIHRDIKSDNMLIGENGEVKLADFGYAVQLKDEEEKRTTVCGSPYWMAPEVINGEKYGKDVDIWSLGIMVMECCDLKPPYFMETPSRALVLISNQGAPPLEHPNKWSHDLKSFLSVCVSKDPSQRPKAIELLQHEFLRCLCGPREFIQMAASINTQQNRKPCLIF